MTVDLIPLSIAPRALIGAFDREKAGKLMEALDACNQRFGRGTVFPASTGIRHQASTWATEFEMRSP